MENNTLDKKDLLNLVQKSISDGVNDGRILGLKEAMDSLSCLLDEKVKKGLEEHLTRSEIQIFMETYIEALETEIKNKQ